MHRPLHAAMDSPDVADSLKHYLGGDRSPLNDADADEDNDAEVYLDPDLLGLDDFADADKLDPGLTGDLDAVSLN